MSKKVQLEGNFGGSREDVYPATMAEIVYTQDGKNLEEKMSETNAQLSQSQSMCNALNKKVYDSENLKMFNGSALYIQTWEGFNDALHPSVLYFENGWNNYKYWMVYTPYTTMADYVDRYECPALVVSNDGIQWKSLTESNLPIDDLTPDEIANKDYFSDPCLLYNQTEDCIEIYYRFTKRPNTDNPILYLKTTKDGIVWSNRVKVYDKITAPTSLSATEWVSPQMFVVNGKYRMYYNIVTDTADKYEVRFVECSHPKNNDWHNVTVTNFTKPFDVKMPWHIGMYKDIDGYHLIGNADNIEYFVSKDGVNFDYVGISVDKDYFNMREQSEWYQSVPVKIGDKWIIYATYMYKYYYNDRIQFHNNIVLFVGSRLTDMNLHDCGMVSDRRVFNNDVLLASSSKKTLSYLTHETADRKKKYGYSMRFHTKEPRWVNPDMSTTIACVVVETKDPDVQPLYASQFWINQITSSIWYAVANNSVDDWKLIRVDNIRHEVMNSIENRGKYINTSVRGIVADNVITIGSYYKGVIESVNNATINNIIGGSGGQEIVIINVTGTPVTLVNSANSDDGNFKLKGGLNVTLNINECIKLFKYSNYWVEM